MRPRLPSFGEIFRPPPSDGSDRDGETCEEDLGDGLLPIPGERPRSASFSARDPPGRGAPQGPPSDFAGRFAALVSMDVRSKPSYTDC